MTITHEQSAGMGGPEGSHRGSRSLRRLISLSGVGALALGSTVLGWSTTTDASTNASGAPASAMLSATSVVQVGTNATYGNILTTSTGQALYTLNTDHNGQSTCTGSCLQVWPALTVAAGTTPTAGPGVTGAVAATMQSNGTDQVTYNGSPLYTYVGDSAPDQVTGQNVGGFFVVTIASSTATTTASPTTTAAAPGTANTPTSTAPPVTAGTSPTPVLPSAATGSSGTLKNPANSSTSASPTAAASQSTLAATGPGSPLMWLLILGLILTILGALVWIGPARKYPRRLPEGITPPP